MVYSFTELQQRTLDNRAFNFEIPGQYFFLDIISGDISIRPVGRFSSISVHSLTDHQRKYFRYLGYFPHDDTFRSSSQEIKQKLEAIYKILLAERKVVIKEPGEYDLEIFYETDSMVYFNAMDHRVLKQIKKKDTWPFRNDTIGIGIFKYALSNSSISLEGIKRIRCRVDYYFISDYTKARLGIQAMFFEESGWRELIHKKHPSEYEQLATNYLREFPDSSLPVSIDRYHPQLENEYISAFKNRDGREIAFSFNRSDWEIEYFYCNDKKFLKVENQIDSETGKISKCI